VSANLQSQIRSYGQAGRNAADGVSVAQTAEGALNEIGNILTRMRELAMQSASDGIGTTERGFVQTESTNLVAEIDRISQTAEFNGVKLLDGSATALDFQVGIRNSANDFLTVTTADSRSATLFAAGAVPVMSTKVGAKAAITDIDAALALVSTARSTFGAVGNRLNSVMSTIQNASENLSAANSRIRDVDVAEETSNMTKANVLQQAGISVLAQANQSPQIALKLLG
jgi:flagellin